MGSGIWLRFRLWWERAAWPIPILGIVGALVLSGFSSDLDEAVDKALEGQTVISASAASAVLGAVGGGMVTFTGFVFSFVVLMLQFGSSQYSPRAVSFFLRMRTTQTVLALFIATITFSFFGLLSIGLGRADYSPQVTVVLASLLLLVSLVGFVVLLQSVGGRVRVDAVVSRLGRLSRRRLRRMAHALDHSAWTRSEADPVPAPDRAVRFTGKRVGQVVAVDPRRVRRLARRTGADLYITALVGDSVGSGSIIGYASPAGAVRARRVSRCLVVDVERSLRYDAAYVLRLLVDIALRGLSPGTHDPTTVVRTIDEIEAFLRQAATVPLGTASCRAGRGSAVVRNRSWSEVVDLALDEIVLFGYEHPQVTRRVVALLDDLGPQVPEDRRPALEQVRARLVAHTASVEPERARFLLTADRQGIGGSQNAPGPDEGGAPADDGPPRGAPEDPPQP